jgi:hypothetical protein
MHASMEANVRLVRLILQVVVRWGEVRVKVIKGNEVLSYEERRSKV